LFPFISFAQARLDNPIGFNTFPELFTAIATAAGELIAALGGVMIVVAGFLFMTSAGRPDKVSQAKQALLFAFIGMFVGGLAVAIVNTIKATLGLN